MDTEVKEKNELEEYKDKTFEEIKHIDELGNEYWEARELMSALEYSKWEHFAKVINKAKISCNLSGFNVEEHFPVKGKTIEMPNGATKEVIDYKLSRYACYLIVQNASPARHKSVALGQTYFAVQTRKMELTQEEYNKLNEDEKRLYTRINIKNKNKYLFDTAKKAGVNNYAKFNDYGYKGLYGGETAKDIAKRKGIDPDKEEILDHMGSNELAANLFRITQTDEVIKNNNITGEKNACNTHHMVGQAIRNTIIKVGGTTPEKLPTPEKSIKEIEKEESKKIESK
ncbi:MAG: DNA damage-inducible protein D [Bacilli bacterium]|nr:DNA damage-inducible protein D [Clostridium sp.]MDY2804832.1 DNA damage-inducible protein D [Bacilli bacterium]